MEPSPVPRVLFRGAPAVSSYHHPAAAPHPPSPEGCLVTVDMRAGNIFGGGRGVCREEGKVGHGSLLGRPWRRHLRRDTPRRWVRALPKRRGAASAIPPRALFLPDDSLPFINSANVRWVPALEQAPGTAVTRFSDLASIERVLVVCVMFYHRRGAAGPAWRPQGPGTGPRTGSRHGGYCYQGTNSCGVGLV